MEMQIAIKTFILFSNKFLIIQGDIFAFIDYYFKKYIFTILTGQKQDMTKAELKFVWPVNMTSNCPKIILSPGYIPQFSCHSTVVFFSVVVQHTDVD